MSGGSDTDLNQFEAGQFEDADLAAQFGQPGTGQQLQAGFRRRPQNGQPQSGSAQSILNSRLGGQAPGGLF